jgi:hypothetical protein
MLSTTGIDSTVYNITIGPEIAPSQRMDAKHHMDITKFGSKHIYPS